MLRYSKTVSAPSVNRSGSKANCLIVQITSGGPADEANLRSGTQQALIAGVYVMISGEVIIAINEQESPTWTISPLT